MPRHDFESEEAVEEHGDHCGSSCGSCNTRKRLFPPRRMPTPKVKKTVDSKPVVQLRGQFAKAG